MRALVSFTLLCAIACSPPVKADTAIIVLDVPVTKQAALAKQIERGARLAVEEINAGGGVRAGSATYKLELRVLDSDESPQKTAANMRTAASIGAVAVIDEGTGVDAGWRIANDAGIAVGIVFQGGPQLVDVATRPNVFRITPTDNGIAFRYAEYLIPKGLKVALITDDSTYGNGGRAALDTAFRRNPEAVAAKIDVPANATDLTPQMLRARESKATAILCWARPNAIALALRAARAAGWDVPFYTPPSGEDPFLRQQFATHPEWIEGMTVALSRLTSEKGPDPYNKFRTALEKRFGPERVGVTSNGRDVIQAPDVPMYSYDFVHVVALAVARAQTSTSATVLVSAFEQVEAQGANGDERAFNEINHEGVVDDDVFFAKFHDMIWSPVKDDPLSATLPDISQTL